ncbi:MAG: hypothetical protein HFI64_14205 [Lachnospiraceae bacterium]|nr:hypothetical protein [Lachnospiraceae bacterium]
MARLVGIGDNVVDLNYTTGIAYPGGNCVNVAVFGRMLSHETAYVGKIAKDRWGEVILHAVREMGVDVSRCEIEEGETGRCGIHLTEGDRKIVEENDAGLVKERPLRVTEDLLTYIRTFDIAHSSCYSHIEGELKKIKDAGIPLLYDFSDEWTAKTLREICPDITVAFFSGKELPEEELKGYLSQCVDEYGCELAVTTIGGRGAIVYNGRRFYTKRPYNYGGSVVDTTGAGDSWITAFICTFFDNRNYLELLRGNSEEHFVREEDIHDMEDCLIEHCMCQGNLLARKNCMVKGSFGYGVTFAEPEM